MKKNKTASTKNSIATRSARVLFGSIAALFAAQSTQAANLVWDGDTSALWSLGTNWATDPLDANVPGTGDTATFSGAGGADDVINLDGVTINTILFDNTPATLAAYIIGSGAVGSQTLTLDNSGAVTMNANVLTDELFNARILLGTATAGTYTFTNDSTTNTLTFAGNVQGGTGGSAAAKTLTVTGAGATAISGNIANGGASALSLTKTGAGTLTLGGNNNFTGAVAVMGGTLLINGTNAWIGSTTINAGTLQFSGATGANNVTSAYTLVNGGSLIVNNTTAAGGNNNDRIGNSSTFVFNGGSFTYMGADAAATNSTETIHNLSGVGNSTITVTFGGTNVAALAAGAFTHAAGNATNLVNGTNLGANNGGASVAKFTSSSAPTLVGATAALTTGINAAVKNTQIVPFLVGEATAGTGGTGTALGTANTFVTYVAGSGYRPLNLTDEFTQDAITAGTNTRLTTGTTVATSTLAINSLVMGGGDLTINDTFTLTNTSGAILFTSTSAINPSVTTGALAFAAVEPQITVNSGITGTISTNITGSAGLTKSGAGILALSGSVANGYTGTTTVNVGTLQLGKSGAVSAITGALTIGSTSSTAAPIVQYTGASSNMMGTGAVTINSAGQLDFNGKTDTIGAVTINATGATGNTTNIANTAGLGNLTIGTLAMTPVAGFTSRINTGTGTLTLGGNVTFTAATTGQARISGNLDFGSAERTFTVGSGTGANYDLLVDAVISGAGRNLIKDGAGVLMLQGANNYTGETKFVANATNGTIRSGANNVLPDASKLFPTGNGTIDLNGFSDTVNGTGGQAIYFGTNTVGQTMTIATGAGTLTLGGNIGQDSNGFGTKAITGNLNLGGATRTIGANGGLLDISAVITNGSISNGASLRLSGANTFAGGITLTGNTTQIGVGNVGSVGAITSSALGTGTLTFGGGTISSDSTTARTILNAVAFTASANGGIGNSTNNGAMTFSADVDLGTTGHTITVNSTAQFDGIVSGVGGGFTKAGAGTLTLNNTGNSNTGNTGVSAGILRSGASDVLPNGSTLSIGGTGTIDLAGFSDTVNGAGGNAISLGVNAIGQTASITTGAGTLTLGGNIATDSNALGNQLISGNLALGAGTRTINLGVGSNAAKTLTISATISGGVGAGLTLASGAGATLLLTGANTYNGPTTLTSNTVQIGVGNVGSVGSITSSAIGTGTLTFNGGKISSDGTTARTILNPVAFTASTGGAVGDATNNGLLTFAGGVTLTGINKLTFNSNALITGTITGNGTLAALGSGTLTITPTTSNSYTGNLGVTSGTLLAGATNAFSSSGGLSLGVTGGINATGTIDLNGFDQTIASIFLGVGVAGQNVILATGSKTLTLNGNITTDSDAFGNATISGNLNLGGGTRTISLGTSGGVAKTLTISALVTDGGITLQSGAGATLLLTNANTYGSGTTLTANTLALGGGNVGSVASITSSPIGTGTLTFNGGGISSDSTTARTILNAITFTGNATLGHTTNNGALTFSANAALGNTTRTLTLNSDAQFDGIISSTGLFGITKAGAGTLTLRGANTYTGLTTVNAGKLILDVATGNNNSATGGMTLSGGITQFNSVDSINGTSRNITVTSPGAVLFGTAFLAANIPAALQSRIVATSTGVIAADNYDATNFDFNTPGLTAASLGAVGAVNYTGTLTPQGTTYRLGGGGGTLTMANTNALTGSNALIVVGNVALTGDNSFTGSTTINASTTLTLNSGITGVGSTSIVNNGTLVINNAGTQSYGGVISGSGALTKNGIGQLTLSTQETYTGTTTINAGTLTLAAGDHTLNINKTLTMTGGTLDLGGNKQYVGQFTGTGGSVIGSGLFTTNMTGAGTFAGNVGGSVSLKKVGSQTLTLTADNTTTGAISQFGGGLTLLDGGALSGATGAITLNGGALTLNNTGTANNNDRVVDGKTIALNGGAISYLGRASTASTETLGDVTLGSGVSLITATPGTGTASAVLTLTSLTRTAGAVLNVNPGNSSNLGTNTNPYGNVKVTSFVGGNLTAVGGVIPGVLSAQADSWQLVGYDSTKGFGVLGTAGFSANYTGTFAAALSTSNLNGVTGAVGTGGKTVNSINQGTVTFTNGTGTGGPDLLTIASGMAIMQTQTFGTTAARGRVTSGTQELIIGHRDGNATPSPIINSVIEDNGNPVALVVYSKKGDRGPYLEMTAANTYSGGTFVTGGNAQGGILLNAGASTVVIPAGGLTINNLGVVDMAGFQGQIDPSNVVTINGGGFLRLMGTNTLAGLVFNSNGGTTVPTVIPYNTITRDANTDRFSVFGAKTGTLVISGNITSNPSNLVVTPLIDSGFLDFAGSAAHDITVAALPEGNFLNTLTPLNGLTISSVIQNGGFIKKGTGVLNPTGNNTFTGDLNIENGVVNVATFNEKTAAGPLGQSANAIKLGKTTGSQTGTIEYTGGNQVSTRLFTMATGGFGAFQVDAATTTLTLQGLIDGGGGLTKTGAGVLKLNGAVSNTYGGLTTVSAGELNLTRTAAADLIPGNVTVASGAILSESTNSNQIADTSAVTIAGSYVLNSNNETIGTLTVNGGSVTTGSASLTLNTAGTQLTMTGGTVLLGVSAGTAGKLNLNGNVTASSSSTIAAINTQSTIASTVDLNGGIRTFNIATGTGAALGTEMTIAAQLTSPSPTGGGITKSGAGTLVLSGASTYSGATTVSAGTLLVSGSLSGTTSVDVSGGTLEITAANRINDAATVTMSAGTFKTDGFAETVGAFTLSGTATIDLGAGASILQLANSSANTWSGGLSITNWSGTQLGGGTDQIFFGTDATGLTAPQIALVSFLNPAGFAAGTYGATQLSTGELVAVPEPGAAVSLLGGLGLLLGIRRRRRA